MTIAGLAGRGVVGVETIGITSDVSYCLRLRGPAVQDTAAAYDAMASQTYLDCVSSAKPQSAGFTSEQIGELLVLDSTANGARAPTLAKERIADLDAKIRERKNAWDALSRLARQCARSTGPCPIIQAFDHP